MCPILTKLNTGLLLVLSNKRAKCEAIQSNGSVDMQIDTD